MAAGVELATAYVSLAVSTKGLAKDVGKQFGQVEKSAGKTGKSAGKRLSGALGGALKKGGAAVAAAGIATLGTAMVKGFQRLNALDQATAKLSGLGHSAKNVDAIMKDALASVKGTAFGMDEAATTAAGAVAAGIKPGKELERTLKLVADAATIGGTSMSEMGGIFNKVATSGKVQGDVINQLNDRGIPIIQLLAEELGKSAEETVALASAGKINFDAFRNAMESGVGGAALKSGETFEGALKNVMAALGRVGANLLSGLFPLVTQGLGAIQSALGPVEDVAKSVGEGIGVLFQALAGQSEINEFDGKLRAVNNAGLAVRDTFGKVTGVVKGFAELLSTGKISSDSALLGMDPKAIEMVRGFRDTVADLAQKAGPAASEFFDYLKGIDLGPIIRGLTPIGTILAGLLPTLKPLLPQLKDLAINVFKALEAILPELGVMFEHVGQAVGQLALVVLPPLMGVLLGITGILPPLIGWIADNASWLTKLAVAVGVAVLAWKGYRLVMGLAKAAQLGFAAASYGVAGATYATGAALKVYNALMTATKIRTIATTVAMKAAGIATKAWTVITKAAAVGQRLLNLAMSANPIGLIVTAIGLLVAGILYLWNTNEGFRNFVIGAWEAIKAAFFTVIDWIKSNVVPIFQAMWAGIKKYMAALILTVTGAWDAVTGAFRAAWDWISGVFTALWGGLVDIFGGPFNTIRNIISVFVGFHVYAFTKAWNWVKNTFSKLWGGLVGIFTKPINAVRAFIVKYMFYYRKTINDLWLWVKGVFSKAWAGWVRILSGPINKIRDFLKKAIQGYRNIITAIWTWVRTTFNRWWTGIQAIFSGPIERARQGIKDLIARVRAIILSAWHWARDTFTRSWNRLKEILMTPVKLAQEGIKRALDSIKQAFTRTKDAIGKAWGGIKKAMSTPVKWVADNIVNPLIDAFNKVAVTIGMDDKQLSRWNFKGFKDGGYTGDMGRSAVAGVVHGREFVMDAATTARAGGARAMETIRGAIRSGWRPAGYKNGGYVQPVPGSGNRHTSGYPWATWAGDYPNPMGTPVKAWKSGVVAMVKHLTTSYGKHVRMNHDDGTSSLYAHLSRILVGVGDHLRAGQVLGRVGSTGNSTGPHLHFETMGGPFRGAKATGSAAATSLFGGFASPIEWLKNLFSGPMAKIKDVANNPWARTVAGIPKLIKDGMVAKVTDLFGSMSNVAGAAGATAWSPVALAALKLAGQPASLLPLLLHRIGVESGGNPRAVNNWDINARNGTPSKGLMQTIQPTFDAYAGALKDRGIFDPLANIYAAIRYTNSRYGGNFAKAWGGRQGYDSGGWLQPGLTLVDNKTGKPEPVFNPRQWDLLQNGMGGGGVTINGNVGFTPVEIVDEIERRQRRQSALRARV